MKNIAINPQQKIRPANFCNVFQIKYITNSCLRTAEVADTKYGHKEGFPFGDTIDVFRSSSLLIDLRHPVYYCQWFYQIYIYFFRSNDGISIR